tara:strand:- start:277 stop:648 length:372 start_codon:yes stop_codon:yes gene_type:complete
MMFQRIKMKIVFLTMTFLYICLSTTKAYALRNDDELMQSRMNQIHLINLKNAIAKKYETDNKKHCIFIGEIDKKGIFHIRNAVTRTPECVVPYRHFAKINGHKFPHALRTESFEIYLPSEITN